MKQVPDSLINDLQLKCLGKTYHCLQLNMKYIETKVIDNWIKGLADIREVTTHIIKC